MILQNKIDYLNFTKFKPSALRKNTIKGTKGQTPESDKLFANTYLIKGLFPKYRDIGITLRTHNKNKNNSITKSAKGTSLKVLYRGEINIRRDIQYHYPLSNCKLK